MPHKTGHHGLFRQKPQPFAGKAQSVWAPKLGKNQDRKKRKKTAPPFVKEKQPQKAA